MMGVRLDKMIRLILLDYDKAVLLSYDHFHALLMARLFSMSFFITLATAISKSS